jgi:hypothetical protein
MAFFGVAPILSRAVARHLIFGCHGFRTVRNNMTFYLALLVLLDLISLTLPTLYIPISVHPLPS